MTARESFAEVGSIEWYAQEQARLRAAGEESARIHAEKKAVAKAQAQAAIDQAVAAADREITGWSDLALRFVRLYATQNKGRRFTGRDIVLASIEAGIIQPENQKAWGGPIQRAARAKFIVRVGTTEDPNRHNNPVPLWEAV